MFRKGESPVLLDDFEIYMYKYYYDLVDSDNKHFQEFFNSGEWLLLFISKFVDPYSISKHFANYLCYWLFFYEIDKVNISNPEKDFLKNVCKFVKENDYKSINKEASKKLNKFLDYTQYE